MRKPDHDMLRINPNPQIVALIDYAIDQIVARMTRKDDWAEWREWAASWKAGARSPGACVDIAQKCFDEAKKNSPSMGHTLGQIAWGAKEACYNAPQSGWLVIRYVADAMVAYGIEFKSENIFRLEPPTIDETASPVLLLAESQ